MSLRKKVKSTMYKHILKSMFENVWKGLTSRCLVVKILSAISILINRTNIYIMKRN